MKRLVLLFGALGTAMLTVVLVFSGDGLLRENQGVDAQTAERPNFVVVLTDDLDQLAMKQLNGIRSVMNANGVTFKNAYVTYS